MWRRYGDGVFAVLALTVFTCEAVVLGVLTASAVLRATGTSRPETAAAVVMMTLIITFISLTVVTAYVLAYHKMSERREQLHAERMQHWTTRWTKILLAGESQPNAYLPDEALDALLSLRDVLSGTEGVRIATLLRQYHVGSRLSHRLHSPKQLKRLEVLEALARARTPEAIPDLLVQLEDPEPRIRLLAARALARTIATLPPGSTRDAVAASLAGALERAALPVGVVEQVFLLLEDAAPRTLRILLDHDDLSPTLRRAALEAIGRLGLPGFDRDLAAAGGDLEPNIRAAGLRALGEVGHLPAQAAAGLRAGFADAVEFVRIQASRSGWLLGEAAIPLLWSALGDRSWWVRRAAGEALLRLDEPGRETLERAGREHHDRYAREMAAQTLRDAPAPEQVGGAA